MYCKHTLTTIKIYMNSGTYVHTMDSISKLYVCIRTYTSYEGGSMYACICMHTTYCLPVTSKGCGVH